jgi:ABC-2 type transport system permease protein
MSALGVLVRHRVRRDRIQLAIWIASTALLALFSASAIDTTYGDDAERAGIMRLAMDNPAILLLRGLPQGTSLAAFTFFQIFTYLALLAALMSSFLAVRHSRAEEETGRAELVASTTATRVLPTAATVVHGVLANVVLGVAVAAAFVSGGLPTTGSVVTGAATAAVGIAFLGVGLLAAQFSRSSRGANSIGVAAVLAAFFLRGVGDSLGEPHLDTLTMTSAWPSWLSPIGWAQHVSAFTRDDVSPLLLCLLLAAGCIAAVFALQSRRDSGASLVPERAGRSTARPSLDSSFALAWRLQWPTIVAWCVGGAAFGLISGSLAGVVVEAARTNPQLAETLQAFVPGEGGSVSQALVSAMFEIVGVIAAACAAQVVMRARQEESGGTAELVLSTPVHRVRWLAGYLAVAAIAVGMVLLSGAVASAVTVLGGGDAAARLGESSLPAAAQLPAALVYLGLVALLFVLLPSVTVPLGWTLVGAGVFLGVFGSLVGVPEWLRDLAPFTHTPAIAGDATDWSGGAWMFAIGVAAASIALVLMRRRELRT